MKITLFSVACTIGKVPYLRYGTFKTREEAVDYVWDNWSKISQADDSMKADVRLSLDIYLEEDDPENFEWDPWYSGSGEHNEFRMSIKPVEIEVEVSTDE